MKSAWSFLQQVLVEFQKDDIIILSAAFVYYAALSIIPLILFLLALTSLTVDFVASIAVYVEEQLATVGAAMGPEVEALLNTTLDDLRRGSLFATMVGLVILVWGASIVFRFLRVSFRKIFGQVQRKDDAADAARELLEYSTVDRFWGFLLVLLVGLFVMASLLFLAITQIFLTYTGISTRSELLYQGLDATTSLLIAVLMLSLLYRFLPPIPLSLRLIGPSALIAGLGYALLRLAFNLYLTYVAPHSTYNLFGSLLVILVFMYFAGLIFFIGAEMTKVRMLNQVAAPPAADQSSPEQSPEPTRH